jgi:hypothetical protein
MTVGRMIILKRDKVEWECRKYGRIGKLPRNGCMSE